MSNIGLFATPENDKALRDYMDLFCVDDEKKAAHLGYNNYDMAITKGQVPVTALLEENNLIAAEVMIVFMTIAGMRWNLLDKESTDESARPD